MACTPPHPPTYSRRSPPSAAPSRSLTKPQSAPRSAGVAAAPAGPTGAPRASAAATTRRKPVPRCCSQRPPRRKGRRGPESPSEPLPLRRWPPTPQSCQASSWDLADPAGSAVAPRSWRPARSGAGSACCWGCAAGWRRCTAAPGFHGQGRRRTPDWAATPTRRSASVTPEGPACSPWHSSPHSSPPFPVLSAAGLAWAVAQGATAGRWSTRRGPSRPAGRRHAGRPSHGGSAVQGWRAPRGWRWSSRCTRAYSAARGKWWPPWPWSGANPRAKA
mmetsp:Transcript_42142/g.91483  ORF Transcript_42142/g.91483 Transcript_42142/m.91483 type:complete len:275 (+) Transcript_42142:1792-2616(+)